MTRTRWMERSLPVSASATPPGGSRAAEGKGGPFATSASNPPRNRMPHTAYLGLGSNLGDRAAILRAAIAALAPYVAVERVSSAYDTAPQLVTDQPRFLNAAVAGTTTLEPLALLRAVKRIERALGRVPGPRYGPRALDIDLLLVDDLLYDTPELTLPHPRLSERAFALVPLAEIAPDLQHPRLGYTIAALATALAGSGDLHCLGPLV